VKRFVEIARRAFLEFLFLPSLIIVGFLALAVGTTILDHSQAEWIAPFRATLVDLLFRDRQATSDLLTTIAGSIITVTSITFSLLLLAVQQAANALTPEAYDQFLLRRINQTYFGFFVGVAVYALIILATMAGPYNPVFGATVALLLTITSLLILILLLYTTINQMRPVVVIDMIHDRILTARKHQHSLLRRTRREALGAGPAIEAVTASTYGYIVRLDIDAVGEAAAAAGEVEVTMLVCIGSYVAFQDTVAEVRASSQEAATNVAEVVSGAIHVEEQRDLDTDPGYGIDQLAIIGWTSVSTAKSNPSPGTLVLHSLRDVLARWSTEEMDGADDIEEPTLVPVVYKDEMFPRLFDAFETLAVVASESMQPQTAAEFYRTFTIMFNRVPTAWQSRVEDLLLRSLSSLGEHVLTAELDTAVQELIHVLQAAGRTDTASRIEEARRELGESIGKLGSRATRAEGRADAR